MSSPRARGGLIISRKSQQVTWEASTDLFRCSNKMALDHMQVRLHHVHSDNHGMVHATSPLLRMVYELPSPSFVVMEAFPTAALVVLQTT
jgi:hypothetical protein